MGSSGAGKSTLLNMLGGLDSLQKAQDNFKLHNPASPLLLGELLPTDEVTQGNQKSLLKPASQQPELFGGEIK